jgi:hypothetical protein
MAAGRFLLRREFGESAAKFRVNEDRVVAETAGAARGNGDFTLAPAFEGLSDRPPCRQPCQRDDAYKSSGPLLFGRIFHLFQQQRDLPGAARIFASVTSGIDSRPPVERVHFQTRIVRERRL